MKLHMQILIALGLGIKRNGHIFLGLIAGIILGIATCPTMRGMSLPLFTIFCIVF